MQASRWPVRVLALLGTLTLVGCGAGGMAQQPAPGAAGGVAQQPAPGAPGGALVVRGSTGCDVNTPCARPTGDGRVTSSLGDFSFTAPAAPPANGGTVTLGVTYHGTTPTKLSVGSKRADLQVLQGDKEIYRWSQDRMFTMILVSEDWAPGQSRTFTLDGVPALQPGTYTAKFFFYGLPGGADAPVLITQWTVAAR